MNFIAEFKPHLPENLRQKFENLKSPFAIQGYLDSLTYKGEERDRSPLNVITNGQGHTALMEGFWLRSISGKLDSNRFGSTLGLIPVWTTIRCWHRIRSKTARVRWQNQITSI